MASVDIVAMLSNLSQSLPSINSLVGGLSYLLGTAFCITALFKLKEAFDESGQQQKLIVPLAYLIMGAGLFFLPSLIDSFSTTLFGTTDNVLAYSATNTYDVYSSMTMLIQTIGFIWFVRGCVLLAHASQPEQGREGSKGHGIKGLLFIIGGLFAINIHSTVNMLDYILTHLMQLISRVGA